MDVAHPIRAVVPSLDGPVLEALAGTRRPLSTLDVHRLSRVGSSMGVRRVLQRLAEQGIVLADHRGNAIYYTANRGHLAWPAIEILAGLRRALHESVASSIDSWAVRPVHASLFGSAARGDGDAASDVDLLLVRPEVEPGEAEAWDTQVDSLRTLVVGLTGNRCQAFVVTLTRLAEHVAAEDPLVEGWLRDGILLAGKALPDLIAPLRTGARS